MKANTETNPVKMVGVRPEQSECEKYLGDWISEKGCEDSIAKTIKKRIGDLHQKCEEIYQIADHGLMAGMGNRKAAITLFKAQVIPSLIFNCESWIGINNTHLNTIQAFQDAFISRLLHLPRAGTAKSLIRMDSGMIMMKWRIAERNLHFTNKLRTKDNNNIAKKRSTMK